MLLQSSAISETKIKVTLIDETETIVQAPVKHTFSGHETFEEVQKFLTGFFPNVALGGFRLGKKGSSNVPSFNGSPLRIYLRKNGLTPSKTSMYAVQTSVVPPKRLRSTGNRGDREVSQKSEAHEQKKKEKVMMHPKMPLAMCQTYLSCQRRKFPRELPLAPVVLPPCTKENGVEHP